MLWAWGWSRDNLSLLWHKDAGGYSLFRFKVSGISFGTYKDHRGSSSQGHVWASGRPQSLLNPDWSIQRSTEEHHPFKVALLFLYPHFKLFTLIKSSALSSARVHIGTTCSDFKTQILPVRLSQRIITMSVHFSTSRGSPHYVRGCRFTQKQS